MRNLKIITITIITLVNQSYPGESIYDKDAALRLKRDLFNESNYDPSLCPAKSNLINRIHSMSPVIVEIDFYFNSILKVDGVSQNFEFLFWPFLFWEDKSLKWDPKDYNDITNIQIPLNHSF